MSQGRPTAGFGEMTATMLEVEAPLRCPRREPGVADRSSEHVADERTQ